MKDNFFFVVIDSVIHYTVMMYQSPMRGLFLLVMCLLHVSKVTCQWSVSATFVNECDESVDLFMSSDSTSDRAVLEKGSDVEFVLCSAACTGFLGASKTYEYSWDATASNSDCDFDTSGSGSVSINGFDAFGATKEVVITCGSITCRPQEEYSPNVETVSYDPVETVSYDPVETVSYDPVETQVQSTSGDGCGGLSIDSLPSKSDSLSGLSAKLSNAVYSEDTLAFQNQVQGLTGASCVDVFYNGKDAEVAVAVDDDSLFVTFRGSSSEADWMDTNINAGLEDVTMGGRTVRLHTGFHDAWKAAEDDVLSIIKKYPNRDVYISGHSLGGALAQIAAFALDNEYNIPVKAVYTFGAPPAGDDNWRTEVMNTALGDTFINYVHPDDPVPFLQYAVDESLLTSVLATLASSFLGGDISGLSNLRIAGRTVTVTDSSCEESDPVFNDFEWKFDDHSMEKYETNVVENCIPKGSRYPACIPSTSSSYTGTCSGDSYAPEKASSVDVQATQQGPAGSGAFAGRLVLSLVTVGSGASLLLL